MPWTRGLGPASEPSPDAAPAADRDDTATIEQAAAEVERLLRGHYPGAYAEYYQKTALWIAKAAAAVLVPATAERIAAEIRAATATHPWSEASLAAGMYHAADLTAGLSAGAAAMDDRWFAARDFDGEPDDPSAGEIND